MDAVQAVRGEVVTGEERGQIPADEGGRGRPRGQDVREDAQVDAGTPAQQQRLRGGDRLTEPQEVHQQLGGVAGTGSADMGDAVGDRRQHGTVTLQDGGVTSHEEPQPRRGGVRGGSADGRLQDADTVRRRLLPARVRGRRRVAAHVDPRGVHRQRPEDDVGHRRRDLGRTGQHREEHVRPRRRGHRGVRPPGPARPDRRPALGPDVVGPHLVPGEDETAAHRFTHPSHTYQADRRHGRMLSRSPRLRTPRRTTCAARSAAHVRATPRRGDRTGATSVPRARKERHGPSSLPPSERAVPTVTAPLSTIDPARIDPGSPAR